jgi:hypothetical protein
MPTNLLTLPPELLGIIVSQLHSDDVKQVRLTCKRLNEIGSHHLYDVLYISSHPLDIEVFETVAKNPLLLQNVRELVIDDTTMSPMLERWPVFRRYAELEEEHWQLRRNSYCRTKQFFPARGEFTVTPDRELHELYRSISIPHHVNRKARKDLELLLTHVPRMHSLRSIVLTNRTADEYHVTGAQSLFNASPTVRLWREFGRERGERPPFPPRCDWRDGWGQPQDSSLGAMYSVDWVDDETTRLIREHNIDLRTEYKLEKARAEAEARSRMEVEEAEEEYDLYDEDSMPNWAGKFRDGDDYDDPSGCDEEYQWTETEDDVQKKWDNFLMDPSSRTISQSARGLRIAIEVMKIPGVKEKLTEFRVDASSELLHEDHQPGLNMWLFNRRSPFPGILTRQFIEMPNLRKINLSLNTIKDDSNGECHLEQGLVAQMLSAAQNLEELAIEAHDMQIFAAIPNIAFPRLRRAEFHCGQLTVRQFSDFITLHRHTLRVLVFSNCGIDLRAKVGTWNDIVGILVSTQKQRTTFLEAVTLHRVYHHLADGSCEPRTGGGGCHCGYKSFCWTLGQQQILSPVFFHGEDWLHYYCYGGGHLSVLTGPP